MAMANSLSHKFCPQCGSPNNRTAKVCVQCGYHFKAASLNSAPSGEVVSSEQSGQSEKSCPKCGTINKLTAKVCIQCGHRFSTQFEQDSPPDLTDSPLKLKEPSITQNPEPPLSLPHEFERLSMPPLPPIPPKDLSTGDKLEGEPAPDLGNDELDALRQQSSEDIAAYERLQRSLRRKQRKP